MDPKAKPRICGSWIFVRGVRGGPSHCDTTSSNKVESTMVMMMKTALALRGSALRRCKALSSKRHIHASSALLKDALDMTDTFARRHSKSYR